MVVAAVVAGAVAGVLLLRRKVSRARREVEMCGGMAGMKRTAGRLLHSLRTATPPTSARPKQVRLGVSLHTLHHTV